MYLDKKILPPFLLSLLCFVIECLLNVNGQDPLQQRAPLTPIPGVINRDNVGNDQCTPAFACQDINIFEIPYIFEHVYANFVNYRSNNLFDMKKSQSCLANKRILVLGDSVL